MSLETHVGLLVLPVQFLDLCGPLDVLKGFDRATLRMYPDIPDATVNRGADFVFHFIGPTMDAVKTWSGVLVQPTCTVHNCPPLDYLIVGGPDGDYIQNVPEEIKNFIRNRAPQVKTLFTTCTGSLVVATTGILDGLEATTQHATVPLARQWFPAVKWTAEKNWVVSKEDKIWTGAGAMAGADMVAHWANTQFGDELAALMHRGLDYTPRSVDGNLIRL